MFNIQSAPQIIKVFKKSFFGLVSIDYVVEDRRPDINIEEKCKLNELGGRFKHFLELKIFWGLYCYRWTFRTNYEYKELPYHIHLENTLKKRGI
mgnify:CR=1 FL=1